MLRGKKKHPHFRYQGKEHWEMVSLQSDFKRHSLVKLLGPVELRIISYTYSPIS
jgi:hypothetical protein